MNSVQTWGEAITLSLLNLWERFVNFLPALVGAILVFVAGWIVAVALGKAVEHIVKIIRIDDVVEKAGTKGRLRKAGVELNIAKFFGGLVKWFLILVFLMAATDILHLVQVTSFLNSIVLYLPNVIVAAVILAVAFLGWQFCLRGHQGQHESGRNCFSDASRDDCQMGDCDFRISGGAHSARSGIIAHQHDFHRICGDAGARRRSCFRSWRKR